MAPKKTAAKTAKTTEATLEYADGQWYIKDGRKKIDVGRSRAYANKMLAEHNAQ